MVERKGTMTVRIAGFGGTTSEYSVEYGVPRRKKFGEADVRVGRVVYVPTGLLDEPTPTQRVALRAAVYAALTAGA